MEHNVGSIELEASAAQAASFKRRYRTVAGPSGIRDKEASGTLARSGLSGCGDADCDAPLTILRSLHPHDITDFFLVRGVIRLEVAYHMDLHVAEIKLQVVPCRCHKIQSVSRNVQSGANLLSAF